MNKGLLLKLQSSHLLFETVNFGLKLTNIEKYNQLKIQIIATLF